MGYVKVSRGAIYPFAETVSHLFPSGIDKTFVIPGYQRDYSWSLEEGQPQQFFHDIVDHIHLNGSNEFTHEAYFIGTMLFKGDWQDDTGKLEVIDGQQRLTFIYLFLGALSNRLIHTANNLKDAGIFGVRGHDLAGEFQKNGSRIREQNLQTQRRPGKKSTHPRLTIEVGDDVMCKLVFGDETERGHLTEDCQAQRNLIETYSYLFDRLSIDHIFDIVPFSSCFHSGIRNDSVDLAQDDESDVEATPALKLKRYELYLRSLYEIETQLNAPTVVVLSMQSEAQVNEIFESLNSKGKNLEQTDLIKNDLFRRLPSAPLDHAHDYWTQIKRTLSKSQDVSSKNSEWIDIEDFFWIYWVAMESRKGSKNNLYEDYLGKYARANQDDLVGFLLRAEDFSHDVAAMYGNESLDYVDSCYREHATEGLHYLVRIQSAKQTFPVLAAALHACRKKLMPPRLFVELIDYLAVAFLFLKDVRGSKYTAVLRSAAYCLAHATRGDYVNPRRGRQLITWYVRNLEDDLFALIGNVSKGTIRTLLEDNHDFDYSNKTPDFKAKTRVSYLLRVRCYSMLGSRESDFTRATESNIKWNVEHILPDEDDADSITHRLGNLLWIDKEVNDRCGNKTIAEKVELYQSAHNPEIAQLGNFFKDLSGDDASRRSAIDNRSVQILFDLYSRVIGFSSNGQKTSIGAMKHADAQLIKKYDDFIATGTKKRQDYLINRSKWIHSFASLFVCSKHSNQKGSLDEDPGSIAGVQYPDDEAFTTPFLMMSGVAGAKQIDSLLDYVQKRIDDGFEFSCTNVYTDGVPVSLESFPRSARTMLQRYRDFLQSDASER